MTRVEIEREMLKNQGQKMSYAKVTSAYKKVATLELESRRILSNV